MASVAQQACVLVCSDSCSKDPSLDESGQYVKEQLEATRLFAKVSKQIVQDDIDSIRQCIKSALSDDNISLIITVGGTGPCPRDVTPEATRPLYDRELNGLEIAMFLTSLRYTPYAALSRLTAGIVGGCVIVNFPGGKKACVDCLSCLKQTLEHLLHQVRFDREAIKSVHEKMDKSGSSQNQSEKDSCKQIDDSTEVLEQRILNLSVSRQPETSFNIPDTPVSKGGTPPKRVETDLISLNDSIQQLGMSGLSVIKAMQSQSPYPLMELKDVLDILSSWSQRLKLNSVEYELHSLEATDSIVGHVLANDLYSKVEVPSFAVSTMDGYVLNVPEHLKKVIQLTKNVPARLVGDLAEFSKLQSDTKNALAFFCYQVNTGGRLPRQNFAVIPVEKTLHDTVTKTVTIVDGINMGAYVRSAASDLSQSDFLAKGTPIGPVELGLILSMGHREVKVLRRPIIGILSTGDELVEFNVASREQDSVVDTNGPVLYSLFKSKGYKIMNRGITRDRPEEIMLNINASLLDCDVLVLTGGASMGSKDHVKDVILKMGGSIHFGRVNIKPGKPVAFATISMEGRQKFIFSLPGNPVSAYMTSMIFVLPFLELAIRNNCTPNQSLSLQSIGYLMEVQIGSIVDGESYEIEGRLEFLRAKFLPSSYKNVSDSLRIHRWRSLSNSRVVDYSISKVAIV